MSVPGEIVGIPTSPFMKDWINGWSKFGKSNFLAECKKVSWEKSLEHLHDLSVLIIQGLGKTDIFAQIIRELKDALKPPNLESDIADLFSFLDTFVSENENDPQRKRYIDVLTECKSLVSNHLWRERLKESSLVAMRLIPTTDTSFTQRQVKTKTRLFYKQQKFNLLREENEGFAKLITELGQFAIASSHETTESVRPSSQQCLQQVYNLIGYFDLDPNRVLAIILDVFDAQLSEVNPGLVRGMTELLRGYGASKKDTADTVGHRFDLLHKESTYAPNNIYTLTAILLREELIELVHIYPYLEPTDIVIEEMHKSNIEKTKSKRAPSTMSSTAQPLPSLNSVSLSSSSQNAGSNSTSSSSSREVCNAVFSATTNASAADSAQSDEKKPVNQKLQLCTALLKVHDWQHAQLLLHRWPTQYATAFTPLAEALCNLLSQCIEPFYNEMCPMPACISKGAPGRQVSLALPQHLQAKNLQELMLNMVLPMCSQLGANLHLQPVLMGQLCRLGAAYMEVKFKDGSNSTNVDAIYQSLFNLLDECILPALVLCVGNSGMAEEVWELIRHFPYEHRYRLYGQWHNNLTTGNNSKLWDAQAECQAQTKYILKRLSKENVKQLGRRLGKLAHSCPTIVFHHIQKTIQLYTNLTQPVVDSFKYLNSLSGDVLAYSIVEKLATDKHKLENFQLSPGFQALATFVALLAKKYHIDLTGALQFVFNQMRNGVSYDLVVLREILRLMTGIEINVENTPHQVEAMCGGEQLRHEAGTFQQVRNTRKNSNRLRDTLLNENLALPLLYALAQRRESLLFEPVGMEITNSKITSGVSTEESLMYWMTPADLQSMRLKLAGIMYDECQETLMQFATFLTLQMGLEELEQLCPSLDELVNTYHVPVDVAFNLTRNIYQFRVNELFRVKCEALQGKEGGDAGGKKLDFALQKKAYVEASKEVFEPIYEQVSAIYSASTWSNLTPAFVTAFWTLQISDLEVPTGAYERQRKNYESQLKKLAAENSPSDPRYRREHERVKQLIDKLNTEEEQCKVHVALMRARLEAECTDWFKPGKATAQQSDVPFEFVWRVIPVRMVTSQLDAEYCAKFALFLHTLRVPGFSLLNFLEKVLRDVSVSVMRFTENEAIHYGQFLKLLLSKLEEWHSDQAKFAECVGHPGWASNEKDSAALQFEKFRHFLYKWHYYLTKAMASLLESSCFTHIRNCLLILTRLLPAYPRITQFCHAISRRTDKFLQNETQKRDLQALGQSYIVKLNQTKSKWIPEPEFHIVNTTNKSSTSASVRFPESQSNSNTTTTSGDTTRSVKRTAPSSTVAASGTVTLAAPTTGGPPPAKKLATVAPSSSSTATLQRSQATNNVKTEPTTVNSPSVSGNNTPARTAAPTSTKKSVVVATTTATSVERRSDSNITVVSKSEPLTTGSSSSKQRSSATMRVTPPSSSVSSSEVQPVAQVKMSPRQQAASHATASGAATTATTTSKSKSTSRETSASKTEAGMKRRGAEVDLREEHTSGSHGMSSPEEQHGADSLDGGVKERSSSSSRHGHSSSHSKKSRHDGASEEKHHRRQIVPSSVITSSRPSSLSTRSGKK